MSAKRTALAAGAMFLIGALGAGGWFYWKNFRGAGAAFRTPPGDIAEMIGTPGGLSPAGPLQLPAGFRISVLAADLPGARVLIRDETGDFWISRTREGAVTRLRMDGDRVMGREDRFTGLRNPHGLAIDPEDPGLLYVAEEDRISRVRIDRSDTLREIARLPSGGRHVTRTLGFGPDGRLYVSIGSSCNACVETDSLRGTICVLQPDRPGLRVFASGLRNAVFFRWRPEDGTLWATEMGRDFLGDDLPPDEIDVIQEGRFYGWPFCFGENLPDPGIPGAEAICSTSVAPVVEIPAHSAPLGLDFVPADGWPDDWRHDLLVAYHGSWNRSTPTGYKLVRVKIDDSGRIEGIEDFVTGWLSDGRAFGRPVDILAEPGGVAWVTDDKAGVVYRIDCTPLR